MVFTPTELQFLRLLDRTKRLSKEGLENTTWKISSAVSFLGTLASKMHDEKNIDQDLLLQYEREVYQLRAVVDAREQKTADDRLAAIDRIPHGFPHVPAVDPSRILEDKPTREERPVRARNRAFFQADMRKQLLGETVQPNLKEDELTDQLLHLTHSLKRNLTATGKVIKDDNKRLVTMQADAETNKEKLEIEGSRLARHAYSCRFDCILLLGALLVFWSFIAVVILIRIFPKPRVS